MKSVICVDVFVLSEFINRLLRLDYDSYIKTKKMDRVHFNFKKFRSIPEGIRAAQDVEMIVKDKILKHFNLVGKVFDKPDISSINLANTDFNDELIIKTCKEHQCVLVTNDADFSGSNIDILTANRKLR